MNLKELRRGLIVTANSLEKLEGSAELTLAKRKCQEAMMWTGTLLKYSKQGENPYAKLDGNRRTVADIEPMFDATSDTINNAYFEEGKIVVVDQLREYLLKQTEAFVLYVESPEDVAETEAEDNMMGVCMVNILTKLTEARMWLGMELGRIRDTQ